MLCSTAEASHFILPPNAQHNEWPACHVSCLLSPIAQSSSRFLVALDTNIVARSPLAFANYR